MINEIIKLILIIMKMLVAPTDLMYENILWMMVLHVLKNYTFMLR